MVTVYAEGVDYSHTPHSNWNAIASALVAGDYRFAGRYAVYDKSPNGRGVTAEEYRTLTNRGIDVFLYYEETTSWMLGGWDAGVRAATRASDVISTETMPSGMPVYYSHDIDPESQHFEAIDECLRGCASIVGFDRVGFYGGWLGVDHVSRVGTAKWFCQTIAWQYGRGVHPAAHLHQYNTGTNVVGGVDCDFVAALQRRYGGAKEFLDGPTPPVPVYADPIPPDLSNGKPFPHIDAFGIVWLEATPRRWKALKDTPRKQRANDEAEEVGPPIKKGERATFIYSVAMPDGSTWFVSKAGSRCRADAFVPSA
jgi:Domain of unknown function (DUF1906).